MRSSIRSAYATLSALVLTGATAAVAQQPIPPLASRWYAGTGGLLETRVFTVKGNSTGCYLLGGNVYGGYALTPTISLQVGLVHGRGGSLDDNFADDGTPKYVPASYKQAAWGVPVQLRYGFSQPTRRFQVDGILGVSIYRTRQTETNNVLYTNVSTDGWYSVKSHASAVNSYFDIGAGFRYAISPQWQATTDVAINANFKSSGYYGISPGAGATVGVRYLFR
ncbi:outer membrane beta-barrel protein [Hymenobacter wooponensis]|uniref:Outer membrane protein beta-barrel domain-containing protein n=1 Tax=Hymenobacter wooponensis TaxID=1525360 RepID=A0A4Z0MEN6_9BACT|nr:outer membrane beta-barrel protein [Hymenobacter wooponensis]TGD77820.1 hypothetical protein EU557_21230 [Hymenobacter wooponensis]